MLQPTSDVRLARAELGSAPPPSARTTVAGTQFSLAWPVPRLAVIRLVIVSRPHRVCLERRRARRRSACALCQTKTTDRPERFEECLQAVIVSNDAAGYATSAVDDLAGNRNEVMVVLLELHSQNLPAHLRVGNHHGLPGFERPCQ